MLSPNVFPFFKSCPTTKRNKRNQTSQECRFEVEENKKIMTALPAVQRCVSVSGSHTLSLFFSPQIWRCIDSEGSVIRDG